MKALGIVVIIVAILAWILFYRFRINIAYYLDLQKMIVCVDVRVLFLRVYCGKIYPEAGQLYIMEKSGEVKIFTKDRLTDPRSINVLAVCRLEKAELFFQIGFDAKMFLYAMLGAAIQMVRDIVCRIKPNITVHTQYALLQAACQSAGEVYLRIRLWDILCRYGKEMIKSKKAGRKWQHGTGTSD